MEAVTESSSQVRLSPHGRSLEKKIRDRSAKVGVVGLGYVGVSLAVEMAKEGYQVKGIDFDAVKVNAVNAGMSNNLDVPGAMLLSLVAEGKVKATQALAAMEDLDALSICVPMPRMKAKGANLSYILAAIEALRNHLRPGQLVVLESSAYPGTTRELVLPRLEETGLQVGEDFFLAYSPKRVDPGNPAYSSRNIPKVIGGITARCTELAACFYRQFIDTVILISSPEAAEMVNLLEKTFRSVNVALANEMALLSHNMHINVWEVIQAASTKPFGFMPFYPGPGIGRQGVPADSDYLAWRVKMNNLHPRLIELATDINSQMPAFMISWITDALNERRKSLNGSRILALGITYERGSNDCRESPAIDIIRRLQQKGVLVSYSDPYVTSIDIDGQLLKSIHLTAEIIESMDCVVLLTDHAEFDYAMISAHSSLILDSRNGFKDCPSPNILPL